MNKITGKSKFLPGLASLGVACLLVGSAGVYAANGGPDESESQEQAAALPSAGHQASGSDQATGQMYTTQERGRMTTREQDATSTGSDVITGTGNSVAPLQRDEATVAGSAEGQRGLSNQNMLDSNEEDSTVTDTEDPGIADIREDDEENDSGWFHPRSRGTTATDDNDWFEDEKDSVVDRENDGVYDSEGNGDDNDLTDQNDEIVDIENRGNQNNMN